MSFLADNDNVNQDFDLTIVEGRPDKQAQDFAEKIKNQKEIGHIGVIDNDGREILRPTKNYDVTLPADWALTIGLYFFSAALLAVAVVAVYYWV